MFSPNSSPTGAKRKEAGPIPQVQALHGSTHDENLRENMTDGSLDLIPNTFGFPLADMWEECCWMDKVSNHSEGSHLAVIFSFISIAIWGIRMLTYLFLSSFRLVATSTFAISMKTISQIDST